MNQFPLWKNLIVLAVVATGLFFAWPNLYPEDPALQIKRDDSSPVNPALDSRVESQLAELGIKARKSYESEGNLIVVLEEDEDQLKAIDPMREFLGPQYKVALTRESRLPPWMRTLGMNTMSLGLDLRGGVYVLYEVDLDAALTQALDNYESSFKTALREADIRYDSVRHTGDGVTANVRDVSKTETAVRLLREQNPELQFSTPDDGEIRATFSDAEILRRKDAAINQNITTMRNRVDELGVAEPLIQRQGEGRIVVQLPGVSDPARVDELLSAVATLEFRLVDEDGNPFEAARTGRAPSGTVLHEFRDGTPILLKRQVIVTGDQLTGAAQNFDQTTGEPIVSVTLDSRGGARMLETTKKNLSKPMAVVFIEQQKETIKTDDGGFRERRFETRKVLSAPTIQGVFGKNFQISGMSSAEAADLALLLRAGSLAAPITKVEERTIGPSLGKDNISKGFRATQIGFLLVVIFMVIYYRVFGLVADMALLMNVVMIVALLSMLQASLTLPGIAGILLTVGMAVDANVLIFERIREELRNGNTPQASIHAGYEKAFSSIADANITTFIAAIVLLAFGTGPIKGFAVVLALGILTSMFTAIVGTRAVVNWWFGHRRLERLPI